MRTAARAWLHGLTLLILTACSSGAGNVPELLVGVNDSGYAARTIEAESGKPAKLTLHNTGTVEHHLGIAEIPLASGGGMTGHSMAGMGGDMDAAAEELQLHIVARPGTRTSLEFTPTKTGEYAFRCVAAGHTEEGVLIVRR